MEELKPIIIPERFKYMDQYIKENPKLFPEGFPVNCLLHKGKTGCGGTEMVLNNERNTIIAVPTKDLIKNKIEPNAQRKERRDYILGVMEGIEEYHIINYIEQYKVKKIMVTYDSLPKVIKIIAAQGGNAYDDYFLLVDEYHRLFLDNLFRDNAVRNLLNEAIKFKSVTFMTATPVDEIFIMDELKYLPVQEIIWEGKKPVDVRVIRTNSVMEQVLSHIGFGMGIAVPEAQNLHFFVNSVSFIASVIKKQQLTPDLARIVCSNTGENKKKLGEEFEISATSSPVKKFNFYTSTVFEGSDILDENGYTIVVSDGNTSSRIIDISTSMKQICGRIRNSKYKDSVDYICPYSKTLDQPFDEYLAYTLEEMDKTQKWVERINDLEEENRKWEINIMRKGLDQTYIRINELSSMLEVDKNKYMLDLYNYKKRCELLGKDWDVKSNLMYNDYIVSEITSVTHEKTPSINLLAKGKVRKCFKDYFEEYAMLKERREKENTISFHFSRMFNLQEERHQILEREYPLVKDAYEKLGVDKVRDMKYKTSNIKRELKKLANLPDSKIVIDYIKKRYSLPCQLEVSTWKEILDNIYHVELGLDECTKAKATDLNKWFVTEYGYIKKEKVTTDVMTVIREKSIIEGQDLMNDIE